MTFGEWVDTKIAIWEKKAGVKFPNWSWIFGAGWHLTWLPVVWISGTLIFLNLEYLLSSVLLRQTRLILPVICHTFLHLPEIVILAAAGPFLIAGQVMQIVCWSRFMSQQAKTKSEKAASVGGSVQPKVVWCTGAIGILSLVLIGLAFIFMIFKLPIRLRMSVHTYCVFGGFCLYAAYASLVTWVCVKLSTPRRLGRFSALCKKRCVQLGCILIPIYAFTLYKLDSEGYLGCAVEWTAFYVVMMFNLTWLFDYYAGSVHDDESHTECLGDDKLKTSLLSCC